MALPGQRLGCHDYKCTMSWINSRSILSYVLAYTVNTGSSAFIILTRKIITASKNATSMAALTTSCLNQRGTRLLSNDSSLTPDARFSCDVHVWRETTHFTRLLNAFLGEIWPAEVYRAHLYVVVWLCVWLGAVGGHCMYECCDL